jgi:putative hydrolase of the HAD superfamily
VCLVKSTSPGESKHLEEDSTMGVMNHVRERVLRMPSVGEAGVIVFDMDDTLVDRESVFLAAQQRMLRTLRSLGAKRIRIPSSVSTLREIELRLIQLHKGAHIYDYRELARALWLHFVDGVSDSAAAKQAYRENIHRKIKFGPAITAARLHDEILFNKMPPLLDSAKKILLKLKKQYLLILFTSGSEEFQKNVIRHHRFDKYFDAIVLKRVKTVSTFREVRRLAITLSKRRLSREPNRLVMVGDRISQDISPARAAGFETIWIPGPYFPGDSHQGRPTHTIRRLEELIEILLR